MSVELSSFFTSDKGTAVKFAVLGDGADGTVTDVQLIDDSFNPGRQVLLVKLSDDVGNVRDLYVRSAGQKEAIGTAVMAAGGTGIEPGARLAITYTGNKALSGGKTLKLYEAKYELPE